MMRTQSSVLLAALAFAFPVSAQTEGQEGKPADVEKLWKIEASGIGG
jgi:hypothetical protein